MATDKAGYSGTPLVRKLGYKPGMRVHVHHAPETYWPAIELPEAVRVLKRPAASLDLMHGFFTQRATLSRYLQQALQALKRDGMVWISWPKKSAGIPSEITEDTVRELALPLGLVDVKVCAVDAIWSGLKLVIRKEQR